MNPTDDQSNPNLMDNDSGIPPLDQQIQINVLTVFLWALVLFVRVCQAAVQKTETSREKPEK